VALPLSYRRTEKPASGGGPAPMTVCADDLAFRHLVEDSLQWSVEKPAGDAAELVAEMVELENQHVGFAAVHTRVRTQIVDDELHALFSEALAASGGVVDVPLLVRLIVDLLVGSSTEPAHVVALPDLLPPPVELIH
jgi:hypothetical protein